MTQSYAVPLFDTHADAAGVRWWSTLGASWWHVTLFDWALGLLTVRGVRVLDVEDDVVGAAARFLGLAG